MRGLKIAVWISSGCFATFAFLLWSSNKWSEETVGNATVDTQAPPAPTSLYKFSEADKAHPFHARQGAWTCDDPKITAEMQDVNDHPGTITDEHYESLAAEGHCAPLDPRVTVRLLDLSEIVIPAGTFSVAKVQIESPSVPDGPNPPFVILQNQLFPGPGATQRP